MYQSRTSTEGFGPALNSPPPTSRDSTCRSSAPCSSCPETRNRGEKGGRSSLKYGGTGIMGQQAGIQIFTDFFSFLNATAAYLHPIPTQEPPAPTLLVPYTSCSGQVHHWPNSTPPRRRTSFMRRANLSSSIRILHSAANFLSAASRSSS